MPVHDVSPAICAARLAMGLLLLPLIGCPEDPEDTPDDDDATTAADDDDSAAACGEGIEPGPGRVFTTSGWVEGAQDGHWSFLGIPYMEPPLGDYRLNYSLPIRCRDGLLAADAMGPACPQWDEGVVVGDEDCLHLNVWTPALDDAARPVLFFVHGGGNIQGSTSVRIGDSEHYLYDGGRIVDTADVVVVTVNYRLGALGWMARPDGDAAAANHGLWDLLKALAWVTQNIEDFGGDPDRVMLFGESAGAVNTCALVGASETYRGFFQRALMQSGGCGATSQSVAQQTSEQKVVELGCGEADDVLECLQAVPVEDFVALSPSELGGGGIVGSGWGPSVDYGMLRGVPLDVIQAAEHAPVPFAIGANQDETSVWVGPLTEAAYAAAVDAVFQTLATEVHAQYPSSDYGSPREAWIALTTDLQFVCPVRRIADAAVNLQPNDTWRYHFTFEPGGLVGQTQGAYHGLELAYLFQALDDVADATGYVVRPEDRVMEAAILEYWTAFAANGEMPGDWPVWDEQDTHLEIGETIAPAQGVRTEHCDFWDSLIPW